MLNFNNFSELFINKTSILIIVQFSQPGTPFLLYGQYQIHML